MFDVRRAKAPAVTRQELGARNRLRPVQVHGGTAERLGVGEELQLGREEPVSFAAVGRNGIDEPSPQGTLEMY